MKNFYSLFLFKSAESLKFLFLVVVFLGGYTKINAQIFTWSSSGSSLWLNSPNWTPSTVPNGITAEAYFNDNAQTLATINMNTASAAEKNIGAIHFGLGATSNRSIRNSSTTAGTLTLNGLTLNSINNVILYNESTGDHRIFNTASQTISLGLGNGSNNIFLITNSGDLTIESDIVGTTMNLTKDGSGTGILFLNSLTTNAVSKTYTGSTTINTGTLSIDLLANGGTASGIGASSNSAGNLNLNGGTLQYTGSSVTSNRSFTLGASTTSTIDVTTTASTLTISGGAASTTGALIKTGTGVLELTGTNSHTGLTTVSAGTLQLNRSGGTTLPVTNNVEVAGGILKISTNQTLNDLSISTGNITVDLGATLTINGSMTITGAGTITNNGTIIYGPTGSLVYSNGAARNVGAEWPNTSGPYNVTLNNTSTNISLVSNETVLNNLTINSPAILTGTSYTLTVGGDWNAGFAGAYTGGTGVPAATSFVIFNGIGSRTFTHTGGAIFRNLTFSGTGNYTVNNDITISVNTLSISNGTVNMGVNSLNGSGDFSMTGGLLQLAKLSTTLPELAGVYSISGGTIELNGSGNQILRGGKDYMSLIFSTSGVKTITSSPSTITGLVTIKTGVVLDATGGASFGGVGTDLTMEGTSYLKILGSGTQPTIAGVYTLNAASTIEFSGNSATIIRAAPSYGNLIVSGTNVSLSGTGTSLDLQSGTSFTVKNGATFNVQNLLGFSGGATTAVGNANAPTIVLENNSTINYNASANQVITTGAVTITPAASNYHHFVISGSGNKTAPSGNLVVAGNISAAGSANYVHNNGTFVANGTAGQTFSSTSSSSYSLYKLSNSSTTTGLTVNSNLTVENEITLNSLSKINLNTGDITLKSDVNATAALAAVPNEAGIITYPGVGRFNIQRYLTGVKAWRLLATPVIVGAASPTITDSWREGGTGLASNGFGTRITGPGAGGAGGTYGTGANFDEFTPNGNLKAYNMVSNSFNVVSEADMNTGKKLANDDGYFLFVRGDRGITTAAALGTATTLQIKGQVRTGDQTFGVDPSKFRSIGNPFPSRLDMRDVYLGGIKLQSFYVWNPSAAGNYNVGQYVGYTFTGTNFTNGAAVLNYIESGQAFFVQNNDPGPLNLVIKETDKTTGSANVSRGNATSPTLEINLKSTDINGAEILADGAILNFDNAYSNGLDNYDVKKISNSFDNIAIKSNGTSLLVERKTALVVTDSIHLNISNMRTANFKFEIDPSLLVHPELTAYLKDRFLQTETEVSLTSITNINFATTTDAASKAANRFVIVFRPSGVLPVTFVDIAAIKNANKTHTVKWAVANELNIQQYEVERSSNGSNFVSIGNTVASQQNDYNLDDAAPLAAINFYRVKAISQNGQVQYSAIVKLTADVKDAYFVVSPNPVQNKTINLQLNGLQKGNYTVNLINSIGQKVFSSSLNINGNAQTKSILLSKFILEGKYTVQMISFDNLIMSQQILVLSN